MFLRKMQILTVLISTLVVITKGADPQFSTVFKPNDGKYPCYRQVNIICNVLHSFFS